MMKTFGLCQQLNFGPLPWAVKMEEFRRDIRHETAPDPKDKAHPKKAMEEGTGKDRRSNLGLNHARIIRHA